MKKYLVIIIALYTVGTVFAQKTSFILPENISVPNDSIVKKQLLSDFDEFLSQLVKPNHENTFVLKEDLLETSILLDEIKNIEASSKYKDDHFYKNYLTNILRLNDTVFKIQFAYIGVNNDFPMLRSSFTVLARKKSQNFYFYSPLKQNVITWKNKEIGMAKVYFKNTLNITKATEFFELISIYDEKLKVPISPTIFYCCDNFNEVLQLIGVDYKADYNGVAFNSLTAKENNTNLIVDGILTSNFTEFDPHDLWHSRLYNVLSTTIINKPVDEGAAYLYGGSWGLTWNQILEKFKIYATLNPKADWIALYNESKNFDQKAKYPLNVDMMINALLIRKIEKEKGFSAIMELLSCGKREKNNENYFQALEKITGISKGNFNEVVWMLIKEK